MKGIQRVGQGVAALCDSLTFSPKWHSCNVRQAKKPATLTYQQKAEGTAYGIPAEQPSGGQGRSPPSMKTTYTFLF